MPPEPFAPDNPREWLRRAESNLVQARQTDERVCLEDLCFQAQQAAEKALKALLLARGGQPPRTHSLAALLRLIRDTGEDVPADIEPVVRLTDYAVATRYPGAAEPVTSEEYGEALCLAERCVAWAGNRMA